MPFGGGDLVEVGEQCAVRQPEEGAVRKRQGDAHMFKARERV